MRISLLKKLNNSMPDSVKQLGAPIIRRQLVNNKVFLNQMKELEMAEHLAEEQVSKLQLEKLKEVLVHAYEHTVYYHELFDKLGFDPEKIKAAEDIKELPVLTKKTIRENYEGLQADDITDYYVGETGGSSGQPLKLLLERMSIYREKAFIYHFWSKYGYDYKKSRIVTFRGVEFGGKISKVNPLYNEVILNPFLLSEGNVDAYARKIEEFKADFIHGYPSAISNFCRLLTVTGVKLNRKIKAVFFISEDSTQEQKMVIEEVLRCKTISFYGHTERSVFAEQTGAGYRFNDLYGYTEIEEHGDGNIICTGFLNKKFPLIRYTVDDEAILIDDEEYSIEGHHTDAFLYGRQDERITQTALNFHDDTFGCVTGYQLLQDQVGKATCYVQAGKKLSDIELAKIKAGLSRKCNVIEWEVLQVDSLMMTERGKVKLIIQNCKHSCVGGVQLHKINLQYASYERSAA